VSKLWEGLFSFSNFNCRWRRQNRFHRKIPGSLPIPITVSKLWEGLFPFPSHNSLWQVTSLEHRIEYVLLTTWDGNSIFFSTSRFGPVCKSYRFMVLRNGISLGIRKKHIRIGNRFDCVEGVIQSIPPGVTFSNTVSKFKVHSLNVCFHWNVAKETFEWLFFQNAIQLQPHGGKNHIVLYQEMWKERWLHVSKLFSATTSQRFNWLGPCPGAWNFL